MRTTETNQDSVVALIGPDDESGELRLYANGSTNYSVIKSSNSEGIGNSADLRIGLDETLRRLIICDRGDIETDFGLTAATHPTVQIYSNDTTYTTYYNYTGCSTNYSYTIKSSLGTNITGLTDRAAGDMVTINSTAGVELTDTDGRQAWLYLEPKINQTNTGAWDGIYLNATLTSQGDGSTGDYNNFFNCAVSGVSKFRVDYLGNIRMAAGTSVYGDGIDFLLSADLASGNAWDFIGTAATKELTAASGTQSWVNLSPNLNQTGSAKTIDFSINATENGVGSGGHTYIECQTDSVPVFNIKTKKVVKAHGSDLFDAVGLTDSVVIWQQPANSLLLSAKIVLNTQFAATGMTDLDVTLGDAGDNSGVINATMNLTSDAANTTYSTRGGDWNAETEAFLYESAAKDWTAYATAVGANLSTTSAGQITFYFSYLQI